MKKHSYGKRFAGLLLGCCMLLPCLAAAEDTPLFQATIALSGSSAPLTFTVDNTGKTDPASDGDPVYRIRITGSDQETFDPLLFPYASGADMEPLLRFVDLNSDGYLDIEALHVVGASNRSSTYFLYNAAKKQFEEAPLLQNLSSYQIYPRQKLILNYEHESAVTGTYTLYRFVDGNPVLFREASVLRDDRDNGESIRELVTEYDDQGNRTVLLDETHAEFASEEEWLQHQTIWLQLLWTGLDATETPE